MRSRIRSSFWRSRFVEQNELVSYSTSSFYLESGAVLAIKEPEILDKYVNSESIEAVGSHAPLLKQSQVSLATGERTV